jgi:hypothetical protein
MSKKRRSAPPAPAPTRRRQPARRRTGPPEWVLPVSLAAGGVVVLAAVVFGLVLFSRGAPSQPASAGSLPTATGQTIDGIQCQTQEQVLYHIHAHMAIFANGQPRTVPLGIGIPNAQVENSTEGPFAASGSCFYWLHSHQTDGIIHVESPSQRTYTLGNWFDIWGQPLSSTQVAGDKGAVIAYVNGQRYSGDPREIPLLPHSVIQLDVGTDVAPRPYTFATGL